MKNELLVFVLIYELYIISKLKENASEFHY